MGEASKLISIDKGIQAPTGRVHRGMERKYPTNTMEIGDSFLVDTKSESLNAYHAAQRDGVKVITRKIPGEGWRVWRIA